MNVPYFRPDLGEPEIEAVVEVLRSGWLTTGQRTHEFEAAFAQAVGARHALAVNSCTAALHLAVEALGLRAGQAVLVPTMTFAATAEVVRYLGATPILVDCLPETLEIDLDDAERKLAEFRDNGRNRNGDGDAVGIIPVHVGGLMLDMVRLRAWAVERGLWVVEDAAHSFPAAQRSGQGAPWLQCGAGTADITAFSFYANKTITTGEGGMATTENDELAARMRVMALHGLSRDAWDRFRTGSSWDYGIVAPGFKYNLTDIAAALGVEQLKRAEPLRLARQRLAGRYRELLGDLEEVELPPDPPDRTHAWHLFPIRLRVERLSIDRGAFIQQLAASGIGTSVHWRPLHLHPYYQMNYDWLATEFPNATDVWRRLISLPLFPTMRDEEIEYVAAGVRRICAQHALHASPAR